MPAGNNAFGDAAYDVIPVTPPESAEAYRVGPFDILNISVFDEPSLTFPQMPVDASGAFDYPLIGRGCRRQTTVEVSREIKRQLDARYLRDARVTVFVTKSAAQRITIEGNVTEPGVYELSGGNASLLEAIAMAKSPTRTANLKQVMVFRTIDNQRMGAVFNLADIRSGAAADPTLRGGDIVVVGFDSLKGAFRDFLTTAPFFNVFQNFWHSHDH
ncbi:MAG: polysaccharide export protein [Sphingomonadales bacterium]|nr:polysaccharide export protein [Sphingomonadales bacterium]